VGFDPPKAGPFMWDLHPQNRSNYVGLDMLAPLKARFGANQLALGRLACVFCQKLTRGLPWY